MLIPNGKIKEMFGYCQHITIYKQRKQGKNRKGDDIIKPKHAIDYSAGKAGIDLSDQLHNFFLVQQKTHVDL